MAEEKFQDLMPEHAIQRRCPVVCTIDVSGSMDGKPLEEVKTGLEQFVNDILSDPQAKKSVDLCLITFGGTVEILQRFAPIDTIDIQSVLQKLSSKSTTPMGTALRTAFQELEEWKQNLRGQGVSYYRPWLLLLTDGLPTDMKRGDATYEEIKQQLQSWQQTKKFVPWAFGTETADFELLKDLFPQGHVYKLAEAEFSAVFKWLSASITKVSRSNPGSRVSFDKPSVSQQVIFEV